MLEELFDRIFKTHKRVDEPRGEFYSKKMKNKKREKIDEIGHYDMDGVSYDGDEVVVSSDGRVPIPHIEEELNENWKRGWSWRH